MGHDLVSGCGGVSLVGLHHAGYAVDAFEQEGKHGDVVLLCQQRIGVVELLDVVGAVVGWKGDSGENDLCAAGLERGYDLVEVSARVRDGQAAQTVIAAEFDDYHCWLEREDMVEALDSVFGGVAADAFVDDAIAIAVAVEVCL